MELVAGTKKGLLLCLIAIATMGIFAIGAAYAQESDAGTTDALLNESAPFYLIELNGPPTVDGSTQAATDRDKESFRAEAKAKGVTYKERKVFSDLFNGMAVTVGRSDASKLAGFSSVRAIYPDARVSMSPITNNPAPDMSTALAQTGADIAQAAGFTGRGIKIAIVDTGTDYNHPDLGGCFGPGMQGGGRVRFSWRRI